MGFYSDIQVVCGKRAAEAIQKAIDGEDDLKSCMRHIGGGETCSVFGAESVKWYPGTPRVEAFESALDELDGKVGVEHAYKVLVINEDNSTEERCNEEGADAFCDFYAVCDFSNPYLRR